MFSDDYMHCFSLIDLRPWKELFNMLNRRKYHKEKKNRKIS